MEGMENTGYTDSTSPSIDPQNVTLYTTQREADARSSSEHENQPLPYEWYAASEQLHSFEERTGASSAPPTSAENFQAPEVRNQRAFDAVRDAFEASRSTEEERNQRHSCYKCSCCVLSFGLLLLLILLPISFSDLEYYEMGFKRRKSTSAVYVQDGLYQAGRHWIGPDFGFKVYQAEAHFVEFQELGVFSSGGASSVGLEFLVDVFFTYRLDPRKLELLHEEMQSTYPATVQSRAKDGIKNEAISFEFEQFFQERTYLERRLRAALAERLRPMHVVLEQFHIGRIKIPSEVSQSQLDAVVQNELNAEEVFKQAATLEREKTQVQVNKINLEAERVSKLARSEAKFIVERAKAEALETRRSAQAQGLGHLYRSLNFTSPEHKASFDYIRTLMNHPNAHLHVTYNDPQSVLETANTPS